MSNRLQYEQSPYLLQHKDNPVSWWAWSTEAFEAAREQDKPIFLSIGYSTCHWCHVMEHESFEDTEVAHLMNEAFINIKVDREERPDIDTIYMTVCQMMTGSGGWPLTIMMTPEKKPFFAATYIPRESRYGRVGMLDLVPRVQQAWVQNRSRIEQDAANITEALAEAVNKDTSGRHLEPDALHLAFAQLRRRFDARHGGFGTAPKFPSPHNLLFLLRYWKRTGEGHALRMVETTLDQMRLGGVYDQIGFGFHRYSTDAGWKLPHFEKMLYDQAMLALAYVEAYQATGKAAYEQTAREIFTYVLRDMTSPQGAFYSAEDADSEGREGKFYLWHLEELVDILGADLANLVVRVYNVEEQGNFEEEATRRRTGENIFHLTKPLAEHAAARDLDEATLRKRLDTARRILFDHRERRIHPGKDDKVLVDWNGLMIAALARAGRVFDDRAYTKAARRAVVFIRATLLQDDGRLRHRYRNGNAGITGTLDDYAFLIWGLLELYETTFDVDALETALVLNKQCLAHFWDDEHAAFFFAADDGEKLIVRSKEAHDSAIPSGNSVMMMNLLRLSRLTGQTDLEQKAHDIGSFFARTIMQQPSGFTAMLMGYDFGLGPSFEVVVAGDPKAKDTEAMLKALHKPYLPNKVVLFRPDGNGEAPSPIADISPFTELQRSRDGVATAYVCRHFQCEQPTTDIDEMLGLLV